MNTDNKENQEEKKMNGQEQKPKIYVIDTGKIKQTKAFARQDGTILGTVWVISFVCTMLAVEPKYHILGLLSNLLIVATPFIVAKRLRIFRDQVRGGHISFRHGLYYCIQTFFYATLLLTITQYLWFRFMDTGMFMSQLQENYQTLAQVYQLTADESKMLLDAISMMKPIAWASMFMITDLVTGAVLSPIIAHRRNRMEGAAIEKGKTGRCSHAQSAIRSPKEGLHLIIRQSLARIDEAKRRLGASQEMANEKYYEYNV